MAEKIPRWYAQGLWTQKMVANAVRKGVLTAQQYKEITGNSYTAK